MFFKKTRTMWKKLTDFVKLKLFENCSKTDCLVCIFIPKHTGFFFPIKGVCQHLSKSYTGCAYFETSLPLAITSWIANVSLLLVVLFNFWPLWKTCPEDRNTCLSLVNNQIISVCGVTIVFLRHFQMKMIIKNFNGWIHLMYQSGQFGIKHLISKSELFKTNLYAQYLRLVNNILLLLFAIYFLFNSPIDYHLIQRLVAFISVYVQVTVAFILSSHSRFYEYIIKNLTHTMKSRLHMKLTKPNLILVDNNLENDLKKYMKFILSTRSSFRYFNRFLNPLMLLWTLFCVMLLILSIYLLLETFNAVRTPNLIFLELQTYVVIILVVYMNIKLDYESSVSIFLLLQYK